MNALDLRPACDLEQLEALAFDELPLDEARRTLEHAGACDACRLELDSLRGDRARFHTRAAAQPALPRLEMFARVERAAQARKHTRRVRREAAAFALCAASLLCAMGLSVRTAGAHAQLSASAAGFDGCDPLATDPGSAAARQCRMASVDEIGLLERTVGACLVATPADCR